MRLAAIAVLASLAACGAEPADTAESGDADWIDEVVAEASVPEWVEVDLEDGVFHPPSAAYRSDVIEIEVPELGQGLEYKLAMREGDAITYAWRVRGADIPALFQSEFHGHTEAVPGEAGTVMFYRKAVGLEESGALVAPFDGIHGWYFLNNDEEPAVVELAVSGFYELIPDQ